MSVGVVLMTVSTTVVDDCAMDDDDCAMADEYFAMADEDCTKLAESLIELICDVVCC